MGRNKRPSHAHILALWCKRQIKFPFDGLLFGLYLSNNSSKLFTVPSFDRPVRLLLNFCKRSLLVMGFLVRYLLKASSVIPWGPSSHRSVLGCLFLSLLLPLPRDTCTRGFLLAGLPSSPGVPFLLALAGRFFDFATKTRTIQKSFQHGEHETDREQRKQHPKC